MGMEESAVGAAMGDGVVERLSTLSAGPYGVMTLTTFYNLFGSIDSLSASFMFTSCKDRYFYFFYIYYYCYYYYCYSKCGAFI